MTPETLKDAVGWVGTSAGLLFVLSWVIERWAWFQGRTPKARQYITVLSAILIPILSLVLLRQVPDSTWLALEPYYQAIVIGISTLIGLGAMEASHKVDKRVTGGRKGNGG